MFTSGFGMVSECSRSLVPSPPQNSTTFISSLAFRIRGASRLPSAHSPGADGWTSSGAARKRRLGGAFSADVALVGPEISPVPVSPAVVYINIIEISVDDFQSRRAFQIEDDIRGADYGRMPRHNGIGLTERAGSTQVGDDLIDEILGGLGKRTILAREIDFSLDAPTAWGDVGRRQHVRKAQAREANILVVEIRYLSVRQI